jgi:hypothetical protein
VINPTWQTLNYVQPVLSKTEVVLNLSCQVLGRPCHCYAVSGINHGGIHPRGLVFCPRFIESLSVPKRNEKKLLNLYCYIKICTKKKAQL